MLPTLPEASVQCVVTSPPYWGLRDYGVGGQLGLEPTPEAYVAAMVGVFRAVRRVLRADGTLWLNMGDSYATGTTAERNPTSIEGPDVPASWAGRSQPIRCGTPGGFKTKDLVGMPWRLAFALQADGWYLRADIIWAKPNPMPESVTDRPTKAHEYVFLLTKSARYFYDADAVREPQLEPGRIQRHGNGIRHDATRDSLRVDHVRTESAYHPAGRNLRSVWTIPSAPFPEAHFATFPPALASRCIQAGTSERGCCAACGAPWERQTDVAYYSSTYGDSVRPDRPGSNDEKGGGDEFGVKRFEERKRRIATTTGWHPSCACDAAVMPCTVLDPFGGSGTVGAVAEGLGRHSVLVELSPAYVAMAERRTAQYGLFTQAPPG